MSEGTPENPPPARNYEPLPDSPGGTPQAPATASQPSGSPAPPSGPAASGGSTTGKRVAVVLAAIVLAIGGAIFVAAAAIVIDTPTCHDVNRGLAQPRDNQCFDGGKPRRAANAGLAGLGGLAAVLALIPGVAYGAREKWLRVFLALIGAAVALILLSVLAGHI